MMFKEQAEKCRAQASQFIGQPEAPFLLSVASAFEELAGEGEVSLITNARHNRARESAPPDSA